MRLPWTRPAAPPPTRFVVLCHARTGSNLICGSLSEHPQIRMLGEIFHPTEEQRRQNAGHDGNPGRHYRDGEDGARYLAREVYGASSEPDIRAAGFKMFYDYARWEVPMRTAWDYLLADHDIRFLLLTRRNLLECLVSHEVALRTDRWRVPAGEPAPTKIDLAPFPLDAERCHAYFDRILTWRTWAAEALRSHPVLSLEYESDLDAHFPATMSRVFEFLDVAPAAAEPQTARQRTKSPAQQLSNFDELRSHFRHTPYTEFFA